MANKGAEPRCIEADSLLALLEALLLIANADDAAPGDAEETIVVNRHLLLQVRQAMLMVADAIERKCGVSPRTSELRREAKGR